jgi:hypothetical protein
MESAVRASACPAFYTIVDGCEDAGTVYCVANALIGNGYVSFTGCQAGYVARPGTTCPNLATPNLTICMRDENASGI